ncbi:MAG: response regulator [Halioglobus sp.]|nr:response regulator [Halioglobus sp.]
MYSKKDRTDPEPEECTEPADDCQEQNLSWLLDLDLSEPEERLFALTGNDYIDEGLSAEEAEVAARPLSRGNASSDDLSLFVEEEIVISSGSQSGIYSGQHDSSAAVQDYVTLQPGRTGMAVDFSQRRLGTVETPVAVEDGADILGLSDDDDIGETFLTIRRVKTTLAAPAAPAIPAPVAEDEPSAAETAKTEAVAAATDDGVWLGRAGASTDATVSDAAKPGHSAIGDDWDSEAWLGQHEDDLGAGVSDGTAIESAAASADTVTLRDAPVTRQVAVPGDCAVANEELAQELAPEPGAETEADQAGATHRDVLDYVARQAPPLDDEEFDQYLLGGEHLENCAADLDEMTVERTEGIVSVDPGTEVTIDYHEDFQALEGFERSSVAVIAATIPQLVAELSALARERVRALYGAPDFVDVGVMLGIDPDSVRQCYADGYEPVAVVCPELPLALQDLAPAELETIHVRLSVGQEQEPRNDLFSAGAGREPGAAATDEEDTRSAREHAADASAQFNCDARPPETGVFDGLDEGALFASDDELEQVFDELSIEQDQTLEQQLPGPEVDALSLQQRERAATRPVTAPDQTPQELRYESPDENLEENPATNLRAPVDSPVENSGFGEDIFAEGFEAELLADAVIEALDIDDAFAGLSNATLESGAICGVDLHEFASGDTSTGAGAGAVEASGGPPALDVPVGQSSSSAWCIPDGIAFNYTSQSGTGIFADFLDAFIEEGSAEVEKLEDAIGAWEKDVRADSAYVPVARILHTLKGIAKGVGLQFYGTLIHNFETLLEGMPRPEPEGEQQYFRIVNAWLDATVQGLEAVRERRADIGSEFPLFQDAAGRGETGRGATGRRASDTPALAPEPAPGPATDSTERAHTPGVAQRAVARQKQRDQQLADEGAKALAAQQSVRITSEKLDQLLNLTNQAQQLGVRAAQNTSRSKRAAGELHGRLTSVRSHIAKIADRSLLNVTARSGGQGSSDLDALEMDQYSELQEAANILREAVEDLSDLVDLSSRHNTQVEALLKQQSSVISTIGSSIQAARVVPVSRLMPGLRRIVRTVGADLDKSVSFKVLNEVGALDRDHYARCQIILEHMVRNALDHGIESPQERLAAGKATTGRITIDVRKAGADYVITLSDDGRGIDPDALRESAYDKGLDVDVDELSDEEALRLIFHKGFSTASSLSEVSGRGVGMDIVLSELQQLGGDIRIQSELGRGTSFELRIPSNVSVNGALFVTAGTSSYAVPLNGLVAIEHVPADEFFAAVENGGTLQFSDLTCEPGYLGTLCHGDSLPDRDTWGSSVPVIIAGSQARHMAIAIDDVEEALELVVRSLGPQFAAVPGLAGAATTSGGDAIVALDLNVLVESVVAGDISAVSVDHTRDNTLLALVVDDSRTQRMVATSQFDTVGVETITAENGLVAIDLLNTTHRLPDVILLDVEMPIKDGIETLREIRKSRRYSHLPVIMVTSRTGAKHRALAQEAGCNGYMGKPFNFPLLIEQINALTGHNLQLS